MSSSEENNVVAQPVDKAIVRKIIKVALILAAVTAVEFFFAFTLESGGLRTSLFVIMTFIKAFYIVAEFMHLNHEAKGLIWTVVTPIIFIVWLVIALLMEGSSIFALRFL